MWKLYGSNKETVFLCLGEARLSESGEKYGVFRSLEFKRPSQRPLLLQSSLEKECEFLGSIEKMAPEDTETVLKFAYDAWGKKKTEEEFVRSYDNSRDHLRGCRYVLRTPEGKLVAGMNSLRFARNLGGVASVATNPEDRCKGYSYLLLKGVMALLEDFDGLTRLLLFSEPDPKFYERLGFRRLPEDLQGFLPSVAMMKGEGELAESEKTFLRTYF